MATSFKAGAVYFALVFAFAFAFGTLRLLLIAPRLGEVPAVLLETPLVLGASWLASRWCLDRFRVPATGAARLAMGAIAFTLLMLAELGVSVLMFARSVQEHLAAYRSYAAMIGLAAQAAFALIPFAQIRLAPPAR